MGPVTNGIPDKAFDAAVSSGPLPAVDGFREKVRTFLAGVALVLLTVVTYANSFSGAFVYDDLDSIVNNPWLRPDVPVEQTLTALRYRQRPVVDASFLLNYRLGGLDPWGYHLVNVSIHVLGVLTLFGLIRRILLLPSLRGTCGPAARLLALLVAALWAVHPLQTQAVTYVVQRAESLCSLLYLLTLYCVIRGCESPRRRAWFAVAVAACAVGMGAKQIMVTAPAAVLLIDRTLISGSFLAALRRSWRLYACLAATWAVLAGLMLAIPAGPTAGFGTISFTPWTYLVTQMGVLTHYLFLIVWPANLVLDYWWPPDPLAEVWPQAILIVTLLALSVAALATKGRLRWAGLCGVLFFLVLSPTSSFVPINDAAMEHRLYLALAAAAALVVGGLYAAGRGLLGKTKLSPQVAGIVVATAAVGVLYLLSTATMARNRVYASERSMWMDVVHKRDNPRACFGLGRTFAKEGRFDDAEKWYVEALRLKDGYGEALNNLGGIYYRQKKLDQAGKLFQQAIDNAPHQAEAHVNLGKVLSLSGKDDAALAEYRLAIALNPNSADAHYALGEALAKKAQPSLTEEALEHLRRANALQPSAAALTEIAAIYQRQGNLPEAVKYFERALRVDARFAPAHLQLGIAMAMQKRQDEALGHFKAAVELAPENPHAFFQFGQAILKKGDVKAAMECFLRAIELDPNMGLAHFKLGALYQDSGNAAEAITCYRNAIRLMPDFALAYRNLGLALEVQDRLDEAIEAYRQAVKLKSDFAEAKECLEKALAKKAKQP